MTADRAGPMRRSRRLDGERKRTLVLAATDAVLQRGGHPNIAAIARAAGVGRKFVYDHPDLRPRSSSRSPEPPRARPTT